MAGDTLTGAKEIAQELGVSTDRVARLYLAGAPIRVLGEGRGRRYLASRAGLRYWLAELRRTSPNIA